MDTSLPPSPRTPRSRPVTSRTATAVLAVLAVVVVALAVALVAVQPEGEAQEPAPPRAEAGDRVRLGGTTTGSSSGLRSGTFLLPWARLDVGVGDVRTELPDDAGLRAAVRAPEDGSFVRVTVRPAPSSGPLATVVQPAPTRVELVLRAGGRDYPVSGPGGPRLGPDDPLDLALTDLWVAVDGRPDDVQLRLSLDDETQVLDAGSGTVDTGRAAAFADLPDALELRGRGTSCGTPVRRDRSPLRIGYRPGALCSVTGASRTPYVGGPGWAEEGREYLVVTLVLDIDVSLVTGPDDDPTSWDVDQAYDVRLGGGRRVGRAVPTSDLLGAYVVETGSTQYVFDVPADRPTGDLVVDLVADASLGEPFPTARDRATFRSTVAGGELG